MQQIKTKIFIQDISNFLSVHHSQKVNGTIYILYPWNKQQTNKKQQLKSPLNVQLKGLG